MIFIEFALKNASIFIACLIFVFLYFNSAYKFLLDLFMNDKLFTIPNRFDSILSFYFFAVSRCFESIKMLIN